jgi:hypothetical protein
MWVVVWRVAERVLAGYERYDLCRTKYSDSDEKVNKGTIQR